MHCLAGRAARKPANGRVSTSRSIPCLRKIPASLAPIQFNTKTLFSGITTLTLSKLCAFAGAPTRTDSNRARQASPDTLFMTSSRSCGGNTFAPHQHAVVGWVSRPRWGARRVCRRTPISSKEGDARRGRYTFAGRWFVSERTYNYRRGDLVVSCPSPGPRRPQYRASPASEKAFDMACDNLRAGAHAGSRSDFFRLCPGATITTFNRRGPRADVVSAAAHHKISQHDGIIVGLVAGREYQRDRSLPRKGSEPIDLLRLLLQLLQIAAAELVPACRVVSEPFPKRCTRGKLFHPFIDCRVRLLDAARPQPVDQHALAVAGRGPIIGAF